jgi:hypothetical protein
VKKKSYYDQGDAITGGISLAPPTISVFDPDGHLPLNLQRSDIAVDALPFQDQLLEAQCEEFIAWALVSAPTSRPRLRMNFARHPAIRTEKPRLPFAFTAEGAVLADSLMFRNVAPTKVIFVPTLADVEVEFDDGLLLIPLDLDGAGNDARKAWFRCSVAWSWRDTFKPFEVLKPSGSRTILRTSFYDLLRKRGAVAGFLWDSIEVEGSNKTWTILRWGSCSSGDIDFKKLLRARDYSKLEGLTEYFHERPIADGKFIPSTLASVWDRIAGETIIPYDLGDRERRFRDAYKALRPMIEYYTQKAATKS